MQAVLQFHFLFLTSFEHEREYLEFTTRIIDLEHIKNF